MDSPRAVPKILSPAEEPRAAAGDLTQLRRPSPRCARASLVMAQTVEVVVDDIADATSRS